MLKRKNLISQRNNVEMYGNESNINLNGCYENCPGEGGGGSSTIGGMIAAGFLIVQVSNDNN